MAKGAAQGGGIAGDAMGLGAGVALGQVMAQQLGQGLQQPPQALSQPGGPSPESIKPEQVMATLEKLGELKAKGILTEEEFASKKAELLKKLV
jgi:membrane protease subunit (stomatin/prohibitin family)